MTRKAIPALLMPGLLLAAVLLLFVVPSAAHPAADLPAFEAPLNPDGIAFEINRDADGWLWVSDYEIDLTGQGEVWQIDPASGDYTLYGGMNAPSDARGDGDGSLWWVDYDNKRIGRLLLGETEAELWQVEGSGGLYGTALDSSGRFWATDTGAPAIHSLDRDKNLCSYEYPSTGTAGYLVAQQEEIWFGDGTDGYLYRLAPPGPTLTQWPLPEGAYLEGLAIDSSGRLWYADPFVGTLVCLDPSHNKLTTFALPAGSMPEMVAAAGERIWFTELAAYGGLGLLDPWAASGETQPLIGQPVAVITDCINQDPDLTLPLEVSQGTLDWTETAYPTTTVVTGIWAAELPELASPWGVVADDHGTWMVDSGRQLLVRLPPSPVDVRACVMADEDGDLDTITDRTPLVDWPVFLLVGGIRQSPDQGTGADGCYTWRSLEVGQQYGLGQTVVEEWIALTPEEHDFGVGISGGGYRYTFVNTPAARKVFLPLVLRSW